MCVFAARSGAATKLYMKPERILIVVDPELSDHPCIDRGAELAQRMDATLELYTCDVDAGIPEGWVGAMNALQYGSTVREQRLQFLEQLAEPLRSRGLSVSTHSDWYPSLESGVLRHIVATKPAVVLDDEMRGIRQRLERKAIMADR
jgi:hypothetical protein